MKPQLFRLTAYSQLFLAVLMATGCTPTQPFFVNESPDLQFYLNSASRIEYPDVATDSLAETLQSAPPLTIGNHDYQFWDLTLEECVSIALQNAKFFVTTGGNSETRQNVAAQFTSASADQLGSIYDVAIQQTTTQSNPIAVDGAGNRTLPNGVLLANQVGGVEDALAEFDAQFTAFVNTAITDRPQNTGFANTVNPPLSQATDVTQQSALSKRFATGGRATIRQQIIYSRNNVDTLGGFARATSSDYTALVEAEVQHPLMRNRGTLINRIPVVLASLNEDIELTDFEIQVRNLVRDVEVAYWDLYVSYRNVATSIVGRNSAQATAYFAKLQFERGAGNKQELAQAKGQYFTFRGQLESALSGSNLPGSDNGVYGRERELRERMGLAATDGRLIRPIEEPTIARVQYDWNEIVSEMLYLAPELRRAKFVIQQREFEEISAKNQILPDVNLSLLYRWVGVGDTFGPSERPGIAAPAPGSSALGELTSGDFQEGSVRLEFTPAPIGARRERSRIRNAQLRVKQSRAFLQDAERLMVSQLSDAAANVATHYQLVQTNAERWQAAEVEVRARLAEFEASSSPINVVLQSQQRKADAELAYYQAVSEYNKSISYVDFLKGTLLANSNITLAEGPWTNKAYHDALERARERSAGIQLEYGVSRPQVIRQGPVGDAAAAHAAGSNVIDGTIVPVGTFGSSDPMGSSIDLQLQPIQPPSTRPLSEMGSSPEEMLSAPNQLIQPDSPLGTAAVERAESVKIPSVSPSVSVPSRSGESKPSPTIQTLSYEQPSGAGQVTSQTQSQTQGRAAISRSAVGSGVSGSGVSSRASGTERRSIKNIKAASQSIGEMTIEPVRRKPLPHLSSTTSSPNQR